MVTEMMQPLWSALAEDMAPDAHVAFRGTFACTAETEVEIRLSGASWFGVWLDGAFLSEGPARFHPSHPAYGVVRVRLAAGVHLLAVQVHHNGVATRVLVDLPPFLLLEVCDGDRRVPIDWRCLRLPGYTAGRRRFNDCLGWIEWADTREWPAWREANFDDTQWPSPVPVAPLPPDHAPWEEAVGGETHYPLHPLTPIDAGQFAERYGYETDDPPVRFFLRDLAPSDLPAQGVWYRYDLGRVRLAHPLLTLDVPAGTPVEFAYSESLHEGRVAPWVTLSASSSCSLDRFLAQGGVQEFTTLEPRGGRFLEVHIGAPAEQVRVLAVAARERCHFSEPQGAFSCGDPLLDACWEIGVNTLRACAEDTMVDTPTRERGAWIGDSLSVGLDIAAVAYSDLTIFRRMLLLAAQGARADGLVAGLASGPPLHMPTFAAQWVTAAVHYWELTGDMETMHALYPAACRNIDAFARACGEDGISPALGWAFIDWGYIPNGGADMAVNLHYLAALGAMQRWAAGMGDAEGGACYRAYEQQMRGIVANWLATQRHDGRLDTAAVGFHRLVLALRTGVLSPAERAVALAAVKAHLLACFPNNPEAPRLADPGVQSTQIFTPYFAHFALPVLIENGEMDFVLGQYRHCWGWAMGEGRTTWLEVFDRRWSHSHHWSGCPTWQLSRYALGLWPRFDLGANVFTLRLHPGDLPHAAGRIPLPGTTGIDVAWTRQPDNTLHYRLTTPQPIWLSKGEERVLVEGEYEKEISWTLQP